MTGVQTCALPICAKQPRQLPVPSKLRRGKTHLADDVLVGEADHEPVLGRVVLVLRLGYKPLARVVVGLTLCEREVGSAQVHALGARGRTTTTAVLHLVSAEVGIILDDLDERHFAVGESQRLVPCLQHDLSLRVALLDQSSPLVDDLCQTSSIPPSYHPP